jgi:hypothetical protein
MGGAVKNATVIIETAESRIAAQMMNFPVSDLERVSIGIEVCCRGRVNSE